MSYKRKWSRFQINLHEVEKFQDAMAARHARNKCDSGVRYAYPRY